MEGLRENPKPNKLKVKSSPKRHESRVNPSVRTKPIVTGRQPSPFSTHDPDVLIGRQDVLKALEETLGQKNLDTGAISPVQEGRDGSVLKRKRERSLMALRRAESTLLPNITTDVNLKSNSVCNEEISASPIYLDIQTLKNTEYNASIKPEQISDNIDALDLTSTNKSYNPIVNFSHSVLLYPISQENNEDEEMDEKEARPRRISLSVARDEQGSEVVRPMSNSIQMPKRRQGSSLGVFRGKLALKSPRPIDQKQVPDRLGSVNARDSLLANKLRNNQEKDTKVRSQIEKIQDDLDKFDLESQKTENDSPKLANKPMERIAMDNNMKNDLHKYTSRKLSEKQNLERKDLESNFQASKYNMPAQREEARFNKENVSTENDDGCSMLLKKYLNEGSPENARVTKLQQDDACSSSPLGSYYSSIIPKNQKAPETPELPNLDIPKNNVNKDGYSLMDIMTSYNGADSPDNVENQEDKSDYSNKKDQYRKPEKSEAETHTKSSNISKGLKDLDSVLENLDPSSQMSPFEDQKKESALEREPKPPRKQSEKGKPSKQRGLVTTGIQTLNKELVDTCISTTQDDSENTVNVYKAYTSVLETKISLTNPEFIPVSRAILTSGISGKAIPKEIQSDEYEKLSKLKPLKVEDSLEYALKELNSKLARAEIAFLEKGEYNEEDAEFEFSSRKFPYILDRNQNLNDYIIHKAKFYEGDAIKRQILGIKAQMRSDIEV